MSRNLYHVKCSTFSEALIGGANTWKDHESEAINRSPKRACEKAKAIIEAEMAPELRSPAAQHIMDVSYEGCFHYEVTKINR